MILIYTRVSTVEQAADGTTSIEEQERKGRAVAQLRGANAFEVQVYTDAGVSGSIPLHQRPAGERLLEEAREGDTIVASKLDRLFRSASDALVTAEQLRERKVHLILVDIGVEPVTTNGVSKMFFGMLALVAEFERERINERTADGRDAKRARGGCVGGVPYGFKKVGEGREAYLVPFDKEQQVIRSIAAMRREGLSPWNIACALNGSGGVATRSGDKWQTVQVQRILDRLAEQKAA